MLAFNCKSCIILTVNFLPRGDYHEQEFVMFERDGGRRSSDRDTEVLILNIRTELFVNNRNIITHLRSWEFLL